MTCSYCDNPVKARGLCEMHYRRLLRGQNLDAPPRFGGVVKSQMAHDRVKKLWGSATQHPCVRCGGSAAEWAYDGTDPGQLPDPRGAYSVWPEFYMPMCVLDHRRYDAGQRRSRAVAS